MYCHLFAFDLTTAPSFFHRADALQTLVRPFMRTIVQNLPLQMNARLAAAALEALGELSVVMKEDTVPYLDELMPLIIGNIQDQSSAHKREVAIRTLGQVVSSTGYVVKPYFQYPVLLPRILDVLKEGGNAMPWSLRREVLRTFGLVGSLDPHKYQEIQDWLRKTKADKVQDQSSQPKGGEGAVVSGVSSDQIGAGSATGKENGGILPVEEEENTTPAHTFMFEMSAARAQPSNGSIHVSSRLTPASEDYHPTVAIKALMNILRDSSLSVHHSMVTQAVIFIFKSLGMRCVPFLDHIVPNMLIVVRSCEHGLRESIIQELAILASIVKHHLRVYLSAVFDVVCDYWTEYLEQVVILVERMAINMREDFKPYVPRLLPLLLSSLSPQRMASNPQAGGVTISEHRLDLILHCIQILRPVLTEYLHIVVPALIKLIDQLGEAGSEAAQWQVRAVKTLSHLYCHKGGGLGMQSESLASRIVHVMIRVLDREGNTPELKDAVIEALTGLALQLRSQYLIFAGMVNKVIMARHVGNVTNYRAVVNRFQEGTETGPFDLENSYAEMNGYEDGEIYAEAIGISGTEDHLLDDGHAAQELALGAGVQKLHVNQQNLQRAWDVSQRSTSDDWGEWMRRFSLELLRESPSPALRSCSALAQVRSLINCKLSQTFRLLGKEDER